MAWTNPVKYDWRKFEKECKAFLVGEHGEVRVRKAAMGILRDAQTDFVKNLPAEEADIMPFITGNLHDSIASVLSYDGRVIAAAYTTPVAREPSLFTGKMVYSPTKGGGRKRIVGAVEAATDVRNMQGLYPGALSASLLIAVPYAENPNVLSEKNKTGKHVGYLEELGYRYFRYMERGFKLYDKYDLFRYKGGRLTWDVPIGLNNLPR